MYREADDRGVGLRLVPVEANETTGLAFGALEAATEEARRAGISSIEMVAWRDLDDIEAGGSELHAHEVATALAAAGLDVSVRTSGVTGEARTVVRNGYRVLRRSGRYAVFPRVAWEMATRTLAGTGADGVVEVWNGMPFFTPLITRRPRVVLLHHVHRDMWTMVLPPRLAALGRFVELRMAPPAYRRSTIVTLSESSRREITGTMRLPAHRVKVAPPGVGPAFSPGGQRAPYPLIVAVGRLVPVKRFCILVEQLARLKEEVGDLQAVIAGEGYERSAIEASRASWGAASWIAMPGHLAEEELVDLYRRAWLVASTSLQEGWGMTLTEAGACGTPAVATDVTGHRDAVLDGRTGILVRDLDAMWKEMLRLIEDGDLRESMSETARQHAAGLSWEAVAARVLRELAADARARWGRSRG